MRTPVLVLSALGAVDDRVRGLRTGGDDYLTKPFALVELVARIEALLRRPVETRETTLHVGTRLAPMRELVRRLNSSYPSIRRKHCDRAVKITA